MVKLVKILIVMICIMLTSGHLFAENESYNEDGNKYQTLLLVLEERLEEQLVKADEIIIHLNESNVSEDVISDLEVLYNELEGILEVVGQANSEGVSEEEAQELFEQSKAQIIEISQEFKVLASESIDEEKREEIRSEVENRVQVHREQMKELIEERRELIKEKKTQHLVQSSSQIAETYNLTEVAELSEQLDNGEITNQEFVQEMRSIISQINDSELKSELISQRNSTRNEIRKTVTTHRNISTEEIIEQMETLTEEEIEKILVITGEDVSTMSDEELIEFVEKYKPQILRYLTVQEAMKKFNSGGTTENE